MIDHDGQKKDLECQDICYMLCAAMFNPMVDQLSRMDDVNLYLTPVG
jgi:hypothetical protein